jgi:hypothetical protein
MATAPAASQPIEGIELEERRPPVTTAVETRTTDAATDAETALSGTHEQTESDATVVPNGVVVGTHRQAHAAEAPDATPEALLTTGDAQPTTQEAQTATQNAQLTVPVNDEQRSVASHEIDREPPPPYHPPPPPYSVAAIANALNPVRRMPKKKFIRFMAVACIVVAAVIGVVVGASQSARTSNR